MCCVGWRDFHLFPSLCAFGYVSAKPWLKKVLRQSNKMFDWIFSVLSDNYTLTFIGGFCTSKIWVSFSAGFLLKKKKCNGVAEIRTQVHALRTHEDGPGYPTTPGCFFCVGCLLILAWHKKTSFDDCRMVAHFSAKVLYRWWVIALES